jgi:hypothetical protein
MGVTRLSNRNQILPSETLNCPVPNDVPTSPVQGCGDNDNSGTVVQAESQKVIRPAGGGIQCLKTAPAYVRECRLAEL